MAALTKTKTEYDASMTWNYYTSISPWQTKLVGEYKSEHKDKKHGGFGSKCKSWINLTVHCQEATASALAYSL